MARPCCGPHKNGFISLMRKLPSLFDVSYLFLPSRTQAWMQVGSSPWPAVDQLVGSRPGQNVQHDLVIRGQPADRVGACRVPGERERLAAAAAEVDLPLRAATARLAHPLGAAVGLE